MTGILPAARRLTKAHPRVPRRKGKPGSRRNLAATLASSSKIGDWDERTCSRILDCRAPSIAQQHHVCAVKAPVLHASVAYTRHSLFIYHRSASQRCSRPSLAHASALRPPSAELTLPAARSPILQLQLSRALHTPTASALFPQTITVPQGKINHGGWHRSPVSLLGWYTSPDTFPHYGWYRLSLIEYYMLTEALVDFSKFRTYTGTLFASF